MKTIKVRGVIVPNDDAWIYEYFEMENTSPKAVESAIAEANGDDIDVEISSGGGDVFAGSDIDTALKSYRRFVTTKLPGIAASAAGVVVIAGRKVTFCPRSYSMCQNGRSMRYSGFKPV